MLTLNQNIEILESFTFRHKAFGNEQSREHFGFGDSWEQCVNKGVKYPFVWVTKKPTKYEKGVIIHAFEVDISDKVNADESNETHVLSDTEFYCLDLINHIRDVQANGDIGLVLGSISDIQDYTEKRDDSVAGNFFTIEFKTHIGDAACNLPINSGNILMGNYIYVGGQTTAGNFQVLIKDQDGNTLQTFNTSGQYVVTVLSGIQQVIGNTSTIITQDIID